MKRTCAPMDVSLLIRRGLLPQGVQITFKLAEPLPLSSGEPLPYPSPCPRPGQLTVSPWHVFAHHRATLTAPAKLKRFLAFPQEGNN